MPAFSWDEWYVSVHWQLKERESVRTVRCDWTLVTEDKYPSARALERGQSDCKRVETCEKNGSLVR